MSTEGGLKAVFAALAANVGIAISKFAAFVFTGSSSMLSEAIHSLADSGNQLLLLFGNKRAHQKRDKTHQFGYGRLRYVYGFVVAIILFLVGGIFSLYEGFHKFHYPEPLEDAWVAFVVLLIAMALEGLSLRTALRESRKVRGRRGLFRFVHDTRQPELPVVMLEDMGALVGLCFALFGVSMATITGNGAWDGLGAMSVGVLLVVIAIFLAMEMASMLVGESALPEEQRAITEALDEADGVVGIVHLRTLHLGPDEILVVAKIGVNRDQTGSQIAQAIDAAEVKLREAVPSKKLVIYLEPDIIRPDETQVQES